MKKLQKLVKTACFLSLFVINLAFAASDISPTAIAKVEKAIVTIDSRILISAYSRAGHWRGTGFITDKEQGFIVTNSHVIGGASIGTYFVTFYDGRQVQATPIYYDLWQDYAILKIDPEAIPVSVEQIVFSKSMARPGQNVYLIGNTGGQEFSVHTGYVSTVFAISGSMPQASYVVNVNIIGGASGSPLLNSKNEAIGVVYGGDKTYALALHGEYVQGALNYIKKGKMPVRKHIGILCEQYSLDKAVRYRHFPKDEMEQYIKRFPDARNKVVTVRTTLAGSPAEDIIKPGDIIWEVNKQPLGGNLSVLDKAMDLAAQETIKLTVFRNGKKLQLELKLYNVNNNKVERMVDFAGATFFQVDDCASCQFGIPLNALAIKNVQTGSSFSSISVHGNLRDYSNRLQINAINEQQVANLDDLIKIIPSTITQQFTSIRFKNYKPYYPKFESNAGYVSAQQELIGDITFDSIDKKPRILEYNANLKEWTTKDINPEV